MLEVRLYPTQIINLTNCYVVRIFRAKASALLKSLTYHVILAITELETKTGLFRCFFLFMLLSELFSAVVFFTLKSQNFDSNGRLNKREIEA